MNSQMLINTVGFIAVLKLVALLPFIAAGYHSLSNIPGVLYGTVALDFALVLWNQYAQGLRYYPGPWAVLGFFMGNQVAFTLLTVL